MRRKPGVLLPLELAICDAAANLRQRGDDSFHGYLIAKALKEHGDARLLTAYGTLYRALARLERMGLLTSRWEDPAIPARENRPGRRLYTLTAAGAFKTRELQFYGANYRQVLNPEGLTYFANASYGFGHPGTEELQFLNYRTRSFYAETGLSYPVIRARERNLGVSGLWFWSNDRGIFLDLPDDPPSTHDRMRGMRVRVDADSADAIGGINQLYFVFSQGVRGLGATQNGQDLASRANGRVDFSKMELTLTRLWPLPLLPGLSGLVAAYGQYAMTPLLVSELCGYGGRLFGRGFDPSQFVGDSCLLAMFELRYDIPIQLQSVTQTQLYGFFDHGYLHNLAPVPGTFTTVDAASFGAGLRLGWLNAVTADLTVTQVAQGQGLVGTSAVPGIVTGPRKNTRFFFILSSRL